MAHWLAVNVWPFAIHAAAATVSGAIVVAGVIAPFKSIIKKLERAIDSVDPQTDTGITRQLHQIHRSLEPKAYGSGPRGKSA